MIGIIKTSDERNSYLSAFIKKDKIFSDNINDFLDISTLILPTLGTDTFLYCKNSNISLRHLYKNNPQIKLVITGVSNKALDDFCYENKIELIEVFKNEVIVYENAKLTAEGLIRIASSNIKDSLGDYNILVLGFGYCAQALINYLEVYTKSINVYAQDYHDKKTIFIQGYQVVESLEDLSKYNLIINTIPSVKIDENNLKTIDSKALLYDIASYPYGFNLELCKKNNYTVNIIPGIPGLVIPASAAKVIYNYIKDKI